MFLWNRVSGAVTYKHNDRTEVILRHSKSCTQLTERNRATKLMWSNALLLHIYDSDWHGNIRLLWIVSRLVRHAYPSLFCLYKTWYEYHIQHKKEYAQFILEIMQMKVLTYNFPTTYSSLFSHVVWSDTHLHRLTGQYRGSGGKRYDLIKYL